MLGQNGLPVPEILWNSCDGMMVVDQERRILAMNPALEQITGHRSQGVVGKGLCAELFSCRNLHGCPLADHPEECPDLKAIKDSKSVQGAEYTIRTADGKRIVMSTSYTPIQLPGQPVWTLAVMRDVTLQKKRERRLARQARTDPLTGLPNRTALSGALFREIKRSARHRTSLAVAIADLDRFKPFNDTHGHPAGDGLLKAVADLLKAGRRATDFIARYGGDEFALLLSETDAAGAMVVTERLRHTLATFPWIGAGLKAPASASSYHLPFRLRKGLIRPDAEADQIKDLMGPQGQGQVVGSPPGPPVTMSVGVAVFPEDGSTPQALVLKADQRLYEAKQAGGNRVVGPP